MTISEALKESKESGRSYSRASTSGYGGWVKYDPQWCYKGLTADDLMADDWEPSSATVERITKGKWTTVESGVP